MPPPDLILPEERDEPRLDRIVRPDEFLLPEDRLIEVPELLLDEGLDILLLERVPEVFPLILLDEDLEIVPLAFRLKRVPLEFLKDVPVLFLRVISLELSPRRKLLFLSNLAIDLLFINELFLP